MAYKAAEVSTFLTHLRNVPWNFMTKVDLSCWNVIVRDFVAASDVVNASCLDCGNSVMCSITI